MTDSSTTAPPELEVLQRFVNTFDVETGADELDSPATLRRFLADAGLPAGRLTAEDLERARRVREALRSLMGINNGQPLDPGAPEVLAAAGRAATLHVEVDGEGRARLSPAGGGLDAALAVLLAAVARAQEDGSWKRMKACAAHTCQWAFYDHSRNRSRTWCDMAVCGNRAKARSYRARTGS